MDIQNESLMERRWLTPQQASKYLGCTRSYLEKDRCVAGARSITYSKLGRHIRYDRTELDAFLQRNKTTSTQEQSSN